jgi:abortive infection bacteriophage resistance protein
MTKAAYNKAALTYQQQLERLKERGLHIPDEDYFLHLLEVKSYYRLSGYWYPLLEDKENHRFKKGASFDIAYSVMYSNLKPGREKREIANAFGLADKVFSSWLHSIVYLRNICAHHARL